MAKLLNKTVVILVIFCLAFEQSGFAQAVLPMPVPEYINGYVAPDRFRPVQLRSVSFDPTQQDFRLFLDTGDAQKIQPKELSAQAAGLMKFFETGLALPNSVFWVNLRPDTAERIIDPSLEKTDLGRVMLASDLALKKDLARFTSPKTEEGRKYWDRLYARAEQLFGKEEISIPTVTRPWIVPGEVIMRETQANCSILKATLKVCLEQDHLKNSALNFDDPRLKDLNEYSSGLIRELVIPKLTREVNSSRKYAELRQAYYSLLLAQWFKEKYRGGQGEYARRIDSGNLEGLVSKKPWAKETYFKAYQRSFQRGEYNITETRTSHSGQIMRQYVSGGFDLTALPAAPAKFSALDGGILPGLLEVDVAGSIQSADGGKTELFDPLIKEFYLIRLRSYDPKKRAEAAQMLSKWNDKKVILAFIEALKDRDLAVKNIVKKSLEEMGSTVVPVLIEALQDNTAPAFIPVAEIAEILGRIGDKRAIDALLSMPPSKLLVRLNSFDSVDKALSSLQASPKAKGEKYIELFNDSTKSELTQGNIIKALCALKELRATEIFIAVLNSSSYSVPLKITVANTLNEISDNRGTLELLALLKSIAETDYPFDKRYLFRNTLNVLRALGVSNEQLLPIYDKYIRNGNIPEERELSSIERDALSYELERVRIPNLYQQHDWYTSSLGGPNPQYDSGRAKEIEDILNHFPRDKKKILDSLPSIWGDQQVPEMPDQDERASLHEQSEAAAESPEGLPQAEESLSSLEELEHALAKAKDQDQGAVVQALEQAIAVAKETIRAAEEKANVIKTLGEEITAAEAKIASVNIEISGFEAGAKKAEADLADIKAKVAAARETSSASEITAQQFRDTYESASNEDMQAVVQALETPMRLAEQKAETDRAEVINLNSELEKTRAEHQTLAEQLSATQAEKAAAETELSRLRKQVASLSDDQTQMDGGIFDNAFYSMVVGLNFWKLKHVDEDEAREKIRSLGGHAVMPLIKIMENAEYYNDLRMAVLLLGDIGDRRAVVPLLKKFSSVGIPIIERQLTEKTNIDPDAGMNQEKIREALKIMGFADLIEQQAKGTMIDDVIRNEEKKTMEAIWKALEKTGVSESQLIEAVSVLRPYEENLKQEIDSLTARIGRMPGYNTHRYLGMLRVEPNYHRNGLQEDKKFREKLLFLIGQHKNLQDESDIRARDRHSYDDDYRDGGGVIEGRLPADSWSVKYHFSRLDSPHSQVRVYAATGLSKVIPASPAMTLGILQKASELFIASSELETGLEKEADELAAKLGPHPAEAKIFRKWGMSILLERETRMLFKRMNEVDARLQQARREKEAMELLLKKVSATDESAVKQSSLDGGTQEFIEDLYWKNRSLEFYVLQLVNGKEQNRIRSALELGFFGNPEAAIPVLVKTAVTDDSDAVRSQARESLKKTGLTEQVRSDIVKALKRDEPSEAAERLILEAGDKELLMQLLPGSIAKIKLLVHLYVDLKGGVFLRQLKLFENMYRKLNSLNAFAAKLPEFDFDVQEAVQKRIDDLKDRIEKGLSESRYTNSDWVIIQLNREKKEWEEALKIWARINEISDAGERSAEFVPGESLKQDGGTVGGIDFRQLPSIILSPMINAVQTPVKPVAPEVLEKQWLGICHQLSAGQVPYHELKEYARQCAGQNDGGKQKDELTVFLMGLLKMEEERAIETAPELREILAMAVS